MNRPSICGIGSIRKLCGTHGAPVSYDASIMNPESNLTRTLTLVLPEADWKALREAEPDAIGWLRTQIQNRLAAPSGSGNGRPRQPGPRDDGRVLVGQRGRVHEGLA